MGQGWEVKGWNGREGIGARERGKRRKKSGREGSVVEFKKILKIDVRWVSAHIAYL